MYELRNRCPRRTASSAAAASAVATDGIEHMHPTSALVGYDNSTGESDEKNDDDDDDDESDENIAAARQAVARIRATGLTRDSGRGGESREIVEEADRNGKEDVQNKDADDGYEGNNSFQLQDTADMAVINSEGEREENKEEEGDENEESEKEEDADGEELEKDDEKAELAKETDRSDARRKGKPSITHDGEPNHCTGPHLNQGNHIKSASVITSSRLNRKLHVPKSSRLRSPPRYRHSPGTSIHVQGHNIAKPTSNRCLVDLKRRKSEHKALKSARASPLTAKTRTGQPGRGLSAFTPINGHLSHGNSSARHRVGNGLYDREGRRISDLTTVGALSVRGDRGRRIHRRKAGMAALGRNKQPTGSAGRNGGNGLGANDMDRSGRDESYDASRIPVPTTLVPKPVARKVPPLNGPHEFPQTARKDVQQGESLLDEDDDEWDIYVGMDAFDASIPRLTYGGKAPRIKPITIMEERRRKARYEAQGISAAEWETNEQDKLQQETKDDGGHEVADAIGYQAAEEGESAMDEIMGEADESEGHGYDGAFLDTKAFTPEVATSSASFPDEQVQELDHPDADAKMSSEEQEDTHPLRHKEKEYHGDLTQYSTEPQVQVHAQPGVNLQKKGIAQPVVKPKGNPQIRHVAAPAKTAVRNEGKPTTQGNPTFTTDEDHHQDLWDAEQIIGYRVRLHAHRVEYCVKWAGYTDIHNTWQLQSHLLGADSRRLLSAFRDKHHLVPGFTPPGGTTHVCATNGCGN